ncbi:MAG: 1-acyl-sn-glycerol-3-phosphate acyltransferase [Paludibacteraceae bacterium]|nr:1-acyl-sn-glycerol-3-phosphate acyltransferase [Paludibacteraceae bacterium]
MNKYFDIDAVISQKFPGRWVPQFLVNYLKRIVHQDDMNAILDRVGDKHGVEFLDGVLSEFGVSAEFVGIENLPPSDSEPLLFVSNHPLGGMDGMVIMQMLCHRYDSNLRVFVNDFLMFVDGLKELFLPINKVGMQSRELSRIMHDEYSSQHHLLTFPAGACSRKINGIIQDVEWRKNFIQNAVKYNRKIVPLYFEGRNSDFFYNLALWRKRLRIKVNIEMMYLVDEMFRQRGNHFLIHVGPPISPSTFTSELTSREWGMQVRSWVYSLGERPQMLRKSQ